MKISEYGIHATKFMSRISLSTQSLEVPLQISDTDQTHFFYSSNRPFARLFVDWDDHVTLAFTDCPSENVTKYILVNPNISVVALDIRPTLAKVMLKVVPGLDMEHKEVIIQNLEGVLRILCG
jgi:hypothetical protein